LNIFISYSGSLNSLELGLFNNIKIDQKRQEGSTFHYLVGTEAKINYKQADIAVFQGHHLDPLNKNIKAIFPATT
jgi:hypothetical protein